MISKSRYNEEMEITQDENVLYERRFPVVLEIGDEVVRYKANEDETLRDIAYNLYRDASLWWIAADVLNVSNPFEVLILKTNIITLPTLKTVTERLI